MAPVDDCKWSHEARWVKSCYKYIMKFFMYSIIIISVEVTLGEFNVGQATV
jgi:hypothetical protein